MVRRALRLRTYAPEDEIGGRSILVGDAIRIIIGVATTPIAFGSAAAIDSEAMIAELEQCACVAQPLLRGCS